MEKQRAERGGELWRVLSTAQSLTRSRRVGAISLDPSAARSVPRSKDHLLPLDRRDLHRNLSALHFRCCMSSLPCCVCIRLEAVQDSSAGVRSNPNHNPNPNPNPKANHNPLAGPDAIQECNPRHPSPTSLPGPACLAQCQEPGENFLHSTRDAPLPISFSFPTQHIPPG